MAIGRKWFTCHYGNDGRTVVAGAADRLLAHQRRRRRGAELRARGLTLPKIGRRLGLSPQLVHYYVWLARGPRGRVGWTPRPRAGSQTFRPGRHKANKAMSPTPRPNWRRPGF